MMKRLVILIFLFNYTLIYPQLGINGGVDYTSFTAGSFKNTKLDDNKYWFNGWFISFGVIGGVEGRSISGDFEMLFQYHNRTANIKFNGNEHKLTNSEVSLSLGPHIGDKSGFGISLTAHLGIGWIGSDTPFEHSGVYGSASIGITPSIIISRVRLFASGKLNIGYFYFSASDPNLYSSDPLLSSDGLISGPEIQIGAGFIF
ncbi:MAG: hypothetical protein KatS3mg037_0900 [Ignavibacterium sp.]|nr:MAG: hypothetical protein KatS3mg037_0900 [Ignavibacterium sp.]